MSTSKFVLSKSTVCGRLGLINEWGNDSTPLLRETPSYMIYTRAGHVPHLTWDTVTSKVELKQDANLFQITLPSHYEAVDAIIEYGKGIKSFCGVPEQMKTHLNVTDPLGMCCTGYNDTKSVAIWTKAGRRSITPVKLCEIVEKFGVNSFSTLFDYDTPVETKNKRLTKAVNRTIDFLDDILKQENGDAIGPRPAVFISIGGGFSAWHRDRSARELGSKSSTGAFNIDLSSFSENLKNQLHVSFDENEILTLLGDSMSHLPEHKLRFCEGAFNPTQILFLTSCGFDLFDSSFATLLAEEGKALRLSDDFPSNPNFATLDFADKQFDDDFTPLFEGCTCYTCRNYTKGYLRHLNNTDELLCPMLLTIHNLTEFDEMFSRIRKYLESRVESA